MTTLPQMSYAPMAEANRRMVLGILRQHGELSRRQIAQMTGLNDSTMTYVVRDLLGRDILRTLGKRASQNVGPKHTLLAINPDAGVLVGVGLFRSMASILITDAAGQVLDKHVIALDHRLDQVPALLRDVVDDRIEQLDIPHRQLLGLGIGVPGVVNTDDGILVHSVSLKVHNFPLRQMFASAFDHVPVIAVDHDANFAALAESRKGQALGLNHFVYILLNQSVSTHSDAYRAFGAALFLNGQLFTGAHFAAGEMDFNLLPRVEANLVNADWQALHEPDAPLSPLLDSLANELGRTIASLVAFIDPQAVILGSNHCLANTVFLNQVRQRFAALTLDLPERQLRIEASTLGQESVALGAVLAAAHASDGHLVSNNPG
jgi:predicted NBD/HSP70 family sugar kinase